MTMQGRQLIFIDSNALTPSERQQRQNIRNAWFCEPRDKIREEIDRRKRKGDWFAAAVLIQLVIDYFDDI